MIQLSDIVLNALSSDLNSLTLGTDFGIQCHSHTQSPESEAKPKVWVNAYKFIFTMLNGKIFLLVIYLRPEHCFTPRFLVLSI